MSSRVWTMLMFGLTVGVVMPACSQRQSELRFLQAPKSACRDQCDLEAKACWESFSAGLSHEAFSKKYDACQEAQLRCTEKCPGAKWGTLEELRANPVEKNPPADIPDRLPSNMLRE